VDDLERFLREQAAGDLVPLWVQAAAASHFGLTWGQVETAILAGGLLPARYQRNRHTISVAQQMALFQSRVAVVGCGGLGGYVIELLARLGVGTIVAIDHDVFEEHNLNRQLFCSVRALGLPKVNLAAERVAQINPAVTLIARQQAFTAAEGAALLNGSNVVVDALDSIPVRLALGDTCATLGIPLVHGAIAGWFGQVTSDFPGDDTLPRLYPRDAGGKGTEQQLGNPSFTPALTASLQAAEVCKILLAAGQPLRRRAIAIDLLDMSFDEIVFAEPEAEPAGA
jgi:molybdopterin-synthase adenylyltransferase